MHNINHVIVFYDPPRLSKNIHNNLKTLGFKVGENNVVSFYYTDSVLPLTMAPKSTHKLVDFPVFSGRVKWL